MGGVGHDGKLTRKMMDVRRVERIAREIIAEYAFPRELVGVQERGEHWHITVRDPTRRLIDVKIADSTPTLLRELLLARLEQAC